MSPASASIMDYGLRIKDFEPLKLFKLLEFFNR